MTAPLSRLQFVTGLAKAAADPAPVAPAAPAPVAPADPDSLKTPGQKLRSSFLGRAFLPNPDRDKYVAGAFDQAQQKFKNNPFSGRLWVPPPPAPSPPQLTAAPPQVQPAQTAPPVQAPAQAPAQVPVQVSVQVPAQTPVRPGAQPGSRPGAQPGAWDDLPDALGQVAGYLTPLLAKPVGQLFGLPGMMAMTDATSGMNNLKTIFGRDTNEYELPTGYDRFVYSPPPAPPAAGAVGWDPAGWFGTRGATVPVPVQPPAQVGAWADDTVPAVPYRTPPQSALAAKTLTDPQSRPGGEEYDLSKRILAESTPGGMAAVSDDAVKAHMMAFRKRKVALSMAGLDKSDPKTFKQDRYDAAAQKADAYVRGVRTQVFARNLGALVNEIREGDPAFPADASADRVVSQLTEWKDAERAAGNSAEAEALQEKIDSLVANHPKSPVTDAQRVDAMFDMGLVQPATDFDVAAAVEGQGPRERMALGLGPSLTNPFGTGWENPLSSAYQNARAFRYGDDSGPLSSPYRNAGAYMAAQAGVRKFVPESWVTRLTATSESSRALRNLNRAGRVAGWVGRNFIGPEGLKAFVKWSPYIDTAVEVVRDRNPDELRGAQSQAEKDWDEFVRRHDAGDAPGAALAFGRHVGNNLAIPSRLHENLRAVRDIRNTAAADTRAPGLDAAQLGLDAARRERLGPQLAELESRYKTLAEQAAAGSQSANGELEQVNQQLRSVRADLAAIDQRASMTPRQRFFADTAGLGRNEWSSRVAKDVAASKFAPFDSAAWRGAPVSLPGSTVDLNPVGVIPGAGTIGGAVAAAGETVGPYVTGPFEYVADRYATAGRWAKDRAATGFGRMGRWVGLLDDEPQSSPLSDADRASMAEANRMMSGLHYPQTMYPVPQAPMSPSRIEETARQAVVDIRRQLGYRGVPNVDALVTPDDLYGAVERYRRMNPDDPAAGRMWKMVDQYRALLQSPYYPAAGR